MTKVTIKDSHDRVIGYIETRSDGVEVGKDARYRIVGYYYPKSDQTNDAHYRVVGHGNILSSLITCGAH